MFAKTAVVILALGICACSLLALRQARLQAANELAEARLRVRAIDERVSLVRAVIAGSITPEAVEEMTQEAATPMVPLAQQREQQTVDEQDYEDKTILTAGGLAAGEH